MMTKRWLLTISLLWLVGCAVPPAGSSLVTPNAAETLSAAELARQQAANAATVQSAEGTRQAAQATQQVVLLTQTAAAVATGTAEQIAQAQTATVETITMLASVQALSAEATLSAIAAEATGTAVVQAARAEQVLVEDEARRLALQREAEAAQLAYQERVNALKPYLWGGAILALIILASGISYGLYQRSRPITVTDVTGPRVLIPANSWQVLPVPRSTSPQLALPASTDEETAVTPVVLPPLAQGHVLIAGETGSGKSTAMLAVLQRRQQVVVLDPHNTPGSWGGAQVIGGGRDFESIGRYMQQMSRLLSQRYDQRARGENQFESLTVATDEMPAIVAALGRRVDEVWREWLREGRKVGLFFVVSTQSTRVKTLGIRGEGDLLENFSYVLMLGKLAASQYPDLVAQMEWPAVLRTIRGVRPVLIPQERPLPGTPISVSPLFIAPAPQAEAFADPNNLTETAREQILGLVQELPSQAAIERRVFGYTGGAAYRAVKEVLDEAKAKRNGQNATTTV